MTGVVAFASNDIVRLLPGATWELGTGTVVSFNGAWFDAPDARVLYGSGNTDGQLTYPYRKPGWAPTGTYQLARGYMEILPISFSNIYWAGSGGTIGTGSVYEILRGVDSNIASGYGYYTAFTGAVATLPGVVGASNRVLLQGYTNYVTQTLLPVLQLAQNAAQRGVIFEYAGGVAPVGWLACDGSALPTNSYPALAAMLGTTYGTAPVGSFRLPDMSGRVPVGRSTVATNTYYVQGSVGGAETVVLTQSTTPSHNHVYTLKSSQDDAAAGSPYVESADSILYTQTPGAGSDGTGWYPDHDTRATGGGAAHNNLAPYIVVKYIIKY